MASQSYLTSKFSHKAFYPRMNHVSPFKSTKVCMSISPSISHTTNTSHTTSRELKGLTSPLLTPITKPFCQPNQDEIKVNLLQADINYMIELKEHTRRALMMSLNDPTMTLKLIDKIQRLGVGYHFKQEIKKLLNEVKHVLPKDDLYTVALNFRLQRHNGFQTNPAETFKNFMKSNGELIMKSSSEDIEGLLSLYEASCLGSSEEGILSHAKEVTKRHLSRSLSQLCPKLHKKVFESLNLPRHMRMERLEARRYIEEYGNEDDHNPILLEFAKYDFNKVQSVFQRELIEVNRWWERLGLSSKLGFIRDRHVECFLWTVGVLPEVTYSSSRIELAKAIAILLVLDDVYDTYGSFDDLVLFTKAIQRWDLNEMEQLPDYMKICFKALYDTNNDICAKLLRERGFSVQPFLRKTWMDMVKAYLVEAEWLKEGTMPTLKDYIENGVTTSGTYMALVHLFFLVTDELTSENSQHLLDSYPKFFTLAGTILRLWDDVGTVKEEQERGDALSSIHLLMKEKNITSEEEGRKEMLQLIYDLWKDLNVELVTIDVMLLPMINVALNMSRASQVVYQHDDDSYLSSVENHVHFLFYEPISV